MKHRDEHIEPESRPAGPAPSESPEDVLSAISAVESQLASLKRSAAERQERDARILEREASLAAREAAFEAQVAEVERDLAIIEQARAAIETERLKAREEQDEQLARLETLQAEAEERSRKIESRAQQLEQVEAKLTDQAHELGRRVEAMEAQSREASERAGAAEERAGLAEKELEAAREGRKQAEEAIRVLEASLAKAQEESSTIFTSVEQSASEIGRLTGQIKELEEHLEGLHQDRDLKATELESARQTCERLEAETAARLSAIDATLGEAEARAGAAETQAARHAERVEQLEALARDLSEQLDQARSSAGSEAEITAREGELRARLEELGEAVRTRDRALAERDALISGLQNKLATATEKITQFGEFIKTQMPGGGGKAAAAMEALQTRAADLQSQVQTLRAERDNLARRLATRPAATGPVTNDLLDTRRERLARIRKQLRLQGRKVRRANELLQDRFAQCESLLSRRAELAAAHQAIQEQRQRYAGQRSRSVAAGATLGVVLMAAVLLGLSWIAAEKVHPGLYAASAIIAADGGERTLTDSARQEWQQYHEQLFEDPRFIESLADMLKRRGIASLGTPGAIQQAIDSGLTIDSPSDGQLHLEYRDEGSTRTERVLDTIAVAVARTANRTRSRRTDGAMSVVSAPAAVGRDPIEGDRLLYTGVIFGGGLCLSLGFGAVVWRRMATAKSSFEHDQQLQALLSEARWQDPRIDIDAEADAQVQPVESEPPASKKKRRRKER